MQIVEWSILGLRSARLQLVAGEGGPQITLFPMVHVGSAGFYRDVFEQACAHDLVLCEGQGGRAARRLTRLYRWAGVARLGLVVQPKAPRGPHVRNADLPADAFDAAWADIPWRKRAVFVGASTCMGLWLRLTASRASIGQNLSLNDLPGRDQIHARSGPDAAVLAVLSDARDHHLCQTLSAAIAERPDRRIAVVFGAAHMPPLLAHLRAAHGYSVAAADWMTVLEDV